MDRKPRNLHFSSIYLFTYFSPHNELSRLKSFLKGNSFPTPLSDRVIKSFLENTFSDTGKNHKVNEEEPTLYFCTSFLGPGSLHFKSRISRLNKQCYPGYKLRIVLSTPKRLSHFPPPVVHSYGHNYNEHDIETEHVTIVNLSQSHALVANQ